MKVLLVDDSQVDQMIVESFLTELGHEVIIGENGNQAVELYQYHKPDIILMDEVMPVMKGREAARAIRDLDGADWVPIIFLSANFNAEDVVSGIDAGGDDYLAKPVDQRILAAKMKALSRIASMRQKLITVSSELERVNAELTKLVDVDGLTGLSNRRFLDRFLLHELGRCQRMGQSLSVVMCDIDFFKKYNDLYGHLAGDDCLRKVAVALKATNRRATDLVARYGGEEFAMVLVGIDEENAIKRAEELRRNVAGLRIEHKGSEVFAYVTLSLGLFTCIPTLECTPQKMIDCADKALYRAKQAGRNRLAIYEREVPASGQQRA